MARHWNDKLLTRERALQLVGPFSLHVSAVDEPPSRAPGSSGPPVPVVHLRCGICGGSCGRFVETDDTNVEDILSGVLRHAVMAHDVSLSLSGVDSGVDHGS